MMITRLFLVLAAASLIALLALLPQDTSVATAQSPGNPPGPPSLFAVDLRLALAETVITPQALAACELHNSATVIFSRLANATNQLTQLYALRQSLSAASNSVTELATSLSYHPGDTQLSNQYQMAVANAQSLEIQIAEARQALFELATEGLSSNQVQKLTTFKQSQNRRLPPEFRVKSRTDAQWQAVELAYIAEGRAQRLGHSLNPQAAALLAELRSDPEVIAAAANLQAHLAEIQALIPTSTSTPNQ